MKFKVGDRVEIIEIDEEDAHYGSRKRYIGQKGEIKSILSTIDIFLDNGGRPFFRKSVKLKLIDKPELPEEMNIIKDPQSHLFLSYIVKHRETINQLIRYLKARDND